MPFELQSWSEREQGKVIVYTTSMGVVRETYQRCQQVHRILGTLLISFEERDVSMNRHVQQELKERLHRDHIVIPQVFVDGQLLGVSESPAERIFSIRNVVPARRNDPRRAGARTSRGPRRRESTGLGIE